MKITFIKNKKPRRFYYKPLYYDANAEDFKKREQESINDFKAKKEGGKIFIEREKKEFRIENFKKKEKIKAQKRAFFIAVFLFVFVTLYIFSNTFS